jgi:hypothetical protein
MEYSKEAILSDFALAIENDKNETIKLFMREYPGLVSSGDILEYAAENGFIKTLTYFVDMGYSVKRKQDHYVLKAAFKTEVQYQILSYLEILPEYGYAFYNEILKCAAEDDNLRMLAYVMATEVLPTDECCQILADAVYANSNAFFKQLLLEVEVSMGELDDVLKACQQCNNLECLYYLIDNKWVFNSNSTNELVYYAIENANIALIKHINKINRLKMVSMDYYVEYACKCEQFEIIEYLVFAAGGMARFNNSAVIDFVLVSKPVVIELLVWLGAKPNDVLMGALLRGNLKMVGLAMKWGASANDEMLEYAIENEHNHIAKLLVSFGCNPLRQATSYYYMIWKISVQINMYFFDCMTKRQQFLHQEMYKFASSYFQHYSQIVDNRRQMLSKKQVKIVRRRLVKTKNHSKNNILKVTLQPKSLHIQMILFD